MADIDDLKATQEQVLAAINRRDLAAFVSLHHDQVVVFLADAPFALDGKGMLQQAMQALLATTESITATAINPQYRVIGNTGIVWSHTALAVKPKDGPLQTTFGRITVTWVKTDGKWLAAAAHASLIPSGQ